MRALLVENYTSVEALSIRDVSSPKLGPGEVRVRVKAAGIGFVEALKIAGRYQTKDPLPFVPGTEFAGLVEEVGDGVMWPEVGEHVFGLSARGAFSDEMCLPADGLWRIPDRLSFVQAAAIPVNYLTAAYGLIELADLSAGQRLLVLGAAGGTGTAAMKIGRMRDAHVIAAAASTEQRNFVLSHGAHQAIDYTTDGWRKTLSSMTDGAPMDVVFDAVGGDISPIAFRTLGWRGRHLVVGFAAGTIPALPMNVALLKGASLVGVDSAQIYKREPETYNRLTREIAAWLDAGMLEPPPTTTFAFERFLEAFDAIRSRQALGKVVVEMSPP